MKVAFITRDNLVAYDNWYDGKPPPVIVRPMLRTRSIRYDETPDVLETLETRRYEVSGEIVTINDRRYVAYREV